MKPMNSAPRRILCADDFSQDIVGLLSYALAKSVQYDAQILVIHVVGRWRTGLARLSGSWAGISFEKSWSRLKRKACSVMRERMAEFCARAPDDSVRQIDRFDHLLVSRGKVAEEIAAQADLFQCDAIVIGCRKHCFWQRWLSPAVASELGRLTRKPVHVVPEDPARVKRSNVGLPHLSGQALSSFD
jgi:nucleotide-binding universal stress UspA family protein